MTCVIIGVMCSIISKASLIIGMDHQSIATTGPIVGTVPLPIGRVCLIIDLAGLIIGKDHQLIDMAGLLIDMVC